MNERKVFAVVLDTNWADELGAILEPYLHPMRAGFEHLRVLYAVQVETQAPFVEVTMRDASAGAGVVLRLPHHAVRLMVETVDARRLGFV